MWNPFKNLNKSAPSIKDIQTLPKQIRESAYNIKVNRVCIRYFFDYTFTKSIDVYGEIIWNLGLPIIIFNSPFEGAVLFIEEFAYNNVSKDNETTLECCPEYPFGIDHKSDLIRHKGIDYYNDRAEITILDESQIKYYKKRYKFYIPIMLKNIPIPIVRLDKADRILVDINEKVVRKLANFSQSLARSFVRIELLKKTGSKKDGIGWILLFGWMMGMVTLAIIYGFIK